MRKSLRARTAVAVLMMALVGSFLAIVGVAAPAGATTGGPDAFGYSFIDNLSPGGPVFAYQDISATGVSVANGDDDSAAVATPFPIRLYSSVVSSVQVTTNGTVSTLADTSFTNQCPQPESGRNFGDAIFVHYDDLVTDVRTQTFGVAPNRTFVIQWTGTYFGGGAVSFNVTFFEGSDRILAQYQTLGQSGVGATVGMDQASGTGSFLPYSCNTAGSTPAGRAIEFRRNVGYYDMDLGSGQAYETPPITAVGASPVLLNDVSAASLAGNAAIFVTNPSNSGYGAEYTNDIGALTTYVQNGGTLIVHDRHVGADESNPGPDARAIVPGIPTAAFFRAFHFQNSELDVDETNPMTQGPKGVLTDTSLDGGNSSSHGYALADSLPPGTVVPVTRPDPNQAATFCYPLGSGHVVYSTIPVDFYLQGNNPAAFRDIYAPNVLAWALAGCPGTQIVPGGGQAVSVTATTATAVEGGTPGAFTFHRSGDLSQNLTVGYQLGGTATSGTDYDPPGTVLFPAGQANVVKSVNALADNVADDGETVTVVVTDGAGYTAAQPAQATVTITEASVANACENAQPSSFPDRLDVPAHTKNIDCIAGYGLAQGFTDGTYRPASPVTRPQMASFVARLLDAAGVTLPANPPDAFPGDNAGPPHELAINQLAALGVIDATTGQTGDKYNVGADMRRDDMAQFLANAYEVITGAPLPEGPNAFTDDEGNDNEAAINALANAHVVEGTGNGLYGPALSVTRGQMASFFARYIQLVVDAGFLQPLP